MAETQLTKDIKLAVKKYMYKEGSNNVIYEAYAGRRNKVDVAALFHNKYTNKSDTTYIEIKISRADFNSGYGLNFRGLYNYICVPVELVEYAMKKMDAMHRWDIGVLLYHEGQIYKIKNSVAAWLRRPQLPNTEIILW